jgi:hypothetical protein
MTFRFHCDPLSNIPVGVSDQSGTRFRIGARLEQNFPNPFRPETTIRYTLDRTADMSLKIYDVRGAVVRVLHTGVQEAGTHSIQWDGRDDNGRRVAAGAYFYQLQTDDRREAKKMIHLK